MAHGEAVVHGSGAWAQQSQPRPGSGDAGIIRASQLEHAVEGKGGDCHLGRPAFVRARALPHRPFAEDREDPAPAGPVAETEATHRRMLAFAEV